MVKEPTLTSDRDSRGHPSEEWHTCPYQADVNGDETTECLCCLACEQECLADI